MKAEPVKVVQVLDRSIVVKDHKGQVTSENLADFFPLPAFDPQSGHVPQYHISRMNCAEDCPEILDP